MKYHTINPRSRSDHIHQHFIQFAFPYFAVYRKPASDKPTLTKKELRKKALREFQEHAGIIGFRMETKDGHLVDCSIEEAVTTKAFIDLFSSRSKEVQRVRNSKLRVNASDNPHVESPISTTIHPRSTNETPVMNENSTVPAIEQVPTINQASTNTAPLDQSLTINRTESSTTATALAKDSTPVPASTAHDSTTPALTTHAEKETTSLFVEPPPKKGDTTTSVLVEPSPEVAQGEEASPIKDDTVDTEAPHVAKDTSSSSFCVQPESNHSSTRLRGSPEARQVHTDKEKKRQSISSTQTTKRPSDDSSQHDQCQGHILLCAEKLPRSKSLSTRTVATQIETTPRFPAPAQKHQRSKSTQTVATQTETTYSLPAEKRQRTFVF